MQRGLTILHLIPTLGGGGAGRQLCLLAAEQVRRGHAVYVGIRREGVFLEEMQSGGVHIERLGDIPAINPRMFFSIVRLIRKVKPDIVQTWLPQFDLIGGLAAVRCGVPWIITERSSAINYEPMRIAAWFRLKLAHYASSVVVANSETGAQYWRDALPYLNRESHLWKNRETGSLCQAIQWTGGDDVSGWPEPFRSAIVKATERRPANAFSPHWIKLETADGPVEVMRGEYIVAQDGLISHWHDMVFRVQHDRVLEI